MSGFYFQKRQTEAALCGLDTTLHPAPGLPLDQASVLGFPDKSIHLYENILDIDAGNVFMMNNLAYVLAVQGKELSRAKELALKAVAVEPENASYLDTLGWVLFKLSEYDNARDNLEKAAGIDTHQPEILDHLAQVYEKLGNPQKAQEMKIKMNKLQKK